jgi:thioredoxin
MKKLLIIFVIASSVISCKEQHSGGASITNVDAQRFKQLLDSVQNEQLVDVRTDGEFREGHLDGAVNIDWNSDLFSTLAESELKKDQPVFVYCYSGGRSAQAADWFANHGFTAIYQMNGGFRSWEQQGLPAIKGEKMPSSASVISTFAYRQFIDSNKVVLVDFSATWCGPCQKLAPKLEELTQEMKGQFVLLKSDVDRDAALADSMQIEAMPTLILYKNGELKWRTTGNLPKEEIAAEIRKVQ